jgi:hypothetical protein
VKWDGQWYRDVCLIFKTQWPNNFVESEKEGKYFAATFLLLTDESFKRINFLWVQTEWKVLLTERGNNLHYLTLYAEDSELWRRELRKQKRAGWKTISWFSDKGGLINVKKTDNNDP